jgi:hypothetical protein
MAEITDKVIGLIIGGLVLFSVFGSMYVQYVASNPSTTYCPPYYNATSPCPTSHTAIYPLLMMMLIIAFLLIVWRAGKGK